MKKRLFLTIILFSILSRVFADDHIVSYLISGTDAMPNRNVRHIYQDSIGFIYFVAHHDMAYSYDGYSFRAITDSEMVAKIKAKRATEQNGIDNKGNSFSLIDDETVIVTDHLTEEQYEIKLKWPEEKFQNEKKRLFVCQDNKDHIWVSAYGVGLVLYDKKTRTQKNINQTTGHIDSNQIVFIMVDRDDNLWVVQNLGPVRCIRIENDNNDRILLGSTSQVINNEVRLLRRLYDGTLIFGNNNGQVYTSRPERAALINKEFNRYKTPEQNYLSAEIDSKGNLWLGSRLNGIIINGKNYGTKGRIDCILRDSKERMWKGSLNDKLYLASYENQQYYEVYAGVDSVRTICEDNLGRIWVGSDVGLYVGDFGNFRKLTDFAILSLLVCGDRLFIGTFGKGLFVADIVEGDSVPDILPMQLPSALPDQFIESIVMNNDSVLFLSTENGCVHYDLKNNKMETVYFDNSQRNNYYYENCAALLDDGSVAFGSASGISIQKADFSSEKVGRHLMVVTDSTITADLVMYSFSRFDYNGNIRSTQFSYLLEEYDQEWSEPSAQNSVSYRHLPFGNYTLRVRWRENYGEWEELSIRFTIPAPWWRTWWAYIIYIIIATTVILISYRQIRRIAHLRQMIAVEKQLTEFKLVFFTNISHEFRMPLTIIQASIDRILSLGTPPAKLCEPINSMSQSVKRMRRLTDQLLLFRKMQNNKLSVAVQETDLPQFLNEIFLTFYDVAEQRNIRATFLPQNWHFKAFIDQDYIDKAMHNLLSNAFKYTQAGGMVTMQASMENNMASIIVEDNGCGISKEKQKHLFDRYITEKLSPDSIGIGLNLTASLIEAHHGTIKYQEREGGGSIFTITIPANEESYSEKEKLQVSRNLNLKTDADITEISRSIGYKTMQSPPLNTHKVLIVEDDNDVAVLIQKEVAGLFASEIAVDAFDALKKIEGQSYNLIITDMMMPKMSGLAMAKKIRTGNYNPNIPIILLTANVDDDLQTKALQTGINVFMTKPFNAEQLRAHCVNLICNSRPAIDTSSDKTEIIIRDEQHSKFLKKLNVIVDSHISDSSLNVDTLVEEFKMSRTALNTKIKQSTGLSSAEFIRNKRIELAKSLLIETNLNIGEIGDKVGMSSPQAFNVTFKKMTGLSPSDFRNAK